MKMWKEFERAGRAVMAAGVLSAALLVVAVPSASARDFDDRGRCQERVERAEAKFNRAVWQHGLYSRQAQRRRYELIQARQQCWNRSHQWWDGRAHQWRNDRDWDRDDRDRR